MRIARYLSEGRPGIGVQHADGSILPSDTDDLLAALRAGRRPQPRSRAAPVAVSDVQLLAPLPRPGKILCCGVNYASHQQENPAAVLPAEPFFFTKLSSAVIGPGQPVIMPEPQNPAGLRGGAGRGHRPAALGGWTRTRLFAPFLATPSSTM